MSASPRPPPPSCQTLSPLLPLSRPQGRAWVWFQNSQVPKWFVGPRGYCPGAIVYDDKEALKAVDQCIFAAFPHGVISLHHTLTTSDAGEAEPI